MSEYIHIGKIVAAHGLAGHIILEHALGTPIHFKGIDAIFIEKNAASFIPYFIQSAAAKTESLTHLQVEGISTREACSILIRQDRRSDRTAPSIDGHYFIQRQRSLYSFA
jgi:16S rRNA processing protein RimM